ncbi:MAG: DinB family protein [Planctomycetota bacterium]|nr:DinB family protein [Planctomycetota bacterium]
MKHDAETLRTHFAELFAHARWANARIIEVMRSIAAPPEEAVAKLAHIGAADEVWQTRLAGETWKGELFARPTLEEAARSVEAAGPKWEAIIAQMPAERLLGEIEYQSTEGTPYSSRTRDVLTHAALHAQYHRGQIATLLKGRVATPAMTDYILSTRQGR